MPSDTHTHGARATRAPHRCPSCNFEGGLPEAWSAWTRMTDFWIYNNPRLGGTIPASWSSMASLTRFEGSSCGLEGSLPASWSAMTDMRLLRFEFNPRLTGPLPPSWSSMRKLEVGKLLAEPMSKHSIQRPALHIALCTCHPRPLDHQLALMRACLAH